jgi:hypothetical protein
MGTELSDASAEPRSEAVAKKVRGDRSHDDYIAEMEHVLEMERPTTPEQQHLAAACGIG